MDGATHAHKASSVETGALFIGPNGENSSLVISMALESIKSHIEYRKNFFPSDPNFITDEMRQTQSFQDTVAKMKKDLGKMLHELHGSLPIFSPRFQAHMAGDVMIPANIGYLAALFYNQNNCSTEGSPVTSRYETEVGRDLCDMLGYDHHTSMGYINAGGTVSNIEALWAARNLKFYPLGLCDAIKHEEMLMNARALQVFLPHKNKHVCIVDTTSWELLNLDVEQILGMPQKVLDQCHISAAQLSTVLSNYTYDAVGSLEFYRRHGLTKSPCYLVSYSGHMSFNRASTILGIGTNNVIKVAIDENGRMDTNYLEAILEDKLASEIPVMCVVAIMGSTEYSSVDPITEIVNIRQRMKSRGLNFAIHADGAWGGYFCTMLKIPFPVHLDNKELPNWFVPELPLSSYTHSQFSAILHADTITIDPHKTGFCAYPGGALCYRDSRMNNLLGSKKVDYYHGDIRLGDLGIQGSKPGAVAAGMALAHRVVGLDRFGYGHILAECMFSSKLLYCLWTCLARNGDQFFVVPTTPLPPHMTTDGHVKYMRENIIGKSNADIAQNCDVMEYLREIGPDTMVPCFTWNLHGNSDVTIVNKMVEFVLRKLSMAGSDVSLGAVPMVVTSSTLNQSGDGSSLAGLKRRLQLDIKDPTGVKFIKTGCLDAMVTALPTLQELSTIMRNTILHAIKDAGRFNG